MDTDKKQKEQDRLRQFSCPTTDSRKDAPTGVLLSDEIEHCVSSFKMIDPFHQRQSEASGL